MLPGYYFLVGPRAQGDSESGTRISTIAVGFTLAGYFAIYIITPL
jgi:hypothetical protein